MLPKIVDDYNIKVSLGKANVSLRSWKGKDIQLIKEIIGDEDNVYLLELHNIKKLVLPYIENYKDEWFTTAEIYKMLFELRKHSIDENIEWLYTCPECEKVNDITQSIDSIVKFNANSLNILEVEGYKFHLDTPIREDVYNNKVKDIKSEIDKLLYEVILQSSKFELDGTDYEAYNANDAFEYFKNLDIKLYTKIIEKYLTQVSTFETSLTGVCEECSHKEVIDEPIVPDFFLDIKNM